jgi:hypothetical protein
MSEDRDQAEGEEPSETFDASDPAQVSARRRTARVREEQRKEFFGRFVADRISREFCWEMLQSLHVFDERFGIAGAANCPEATILYRGEREAGLRLLRALLRSQPNFTARMIAENDHG